MTQTGMRSVLHRKQPFLAWSALSGRAPVLPCTGTVLISSCFHVSVFLPSGPTFGVLWRQSGHHWPAPYTEQLNSISPKAFGSFGVGTSFWFIWCGHKRPPQFPANPGRNPNFRRFRGATYSVRGYSAGLLALEDWVPPWWQPCRQRPLAHRANQRELMDSPNFPTSQLPN